MESSSEPVPAKGPTVERIPPGDDRPRLVCNDCGFVNYVNPKVVVGAVATWGSQFLLVKRAIEPRKGHWTIPAGFLEVGETVEAGAVRETWEEARARITIDALLGVYNITRIAQVYLVFRAHLLEEAFAPGPESQEAGLFSWDDIPWSDLAFPSVQWALEHYKDAQGQTDVVPSREPPTIHWER
jgi:ADP-ribose pyrophosphatase YjhB (NUDIX family)